MVDNEKQVNALMQQASAGINSGNLEQAEQAVKQLFAVDPDDMVAHFFMGVIHHGRNKFEEALAEFKAAVEIDPTQAPFHVNLGQTYQSLMDFEQAMVHFQLAAFLQPDNIDALNSAGFLFLRFGKHNYARMYFEKAIESNQDNFLAYLGDGHVKQMNRNIDGSLDAYLNCLLRNPDEPTARVNYGFMLLAKNIQLLFKSPT